MEEEYQTRSDHMFRHAGICFFDSLQEAYQAACEDVSIWKISYTGHRWRRYFNSKTGEITWSDEPIRIINNESISTSLEILTDKEFKKFVENYS